MTSWQGLSMLPYFLAAKKARENPRLNSFHQQTKTFSDHLFLIKRFSGVFILHKVTFKY
jgi:hypothetical protein